MGLAYKPFDGSPKTLSAVGYSLRGVIFAVIFAAAVTSRLFAVIRHESIIHEFDPAVCRSTRASFFGLHFSSSTTVRQEC